MSFIYNYVLVALSVLVAVQAGYVGLVLAQRIPASFALNRRLLIAASAITLSVGIWSMHFIGMLAIVTTATIDYLVLPTLLSFLVCVLVTGIAIYLATLSSRKWLIFGAIFMGLGIATMHYVGMMALHSSAHMEHNHFFVAASVVIAIAASGLALYLAFLASDRFPTLDLLFQACTTPLWRARD
jgi:diguanylate cyclase